MEIILDKQQAVTIAISLLNGEKERGDYGFKALKESELILKNILDATLMEKEVMTTPLLSKTILDLERE